MSLLDINFGMRRFTRNRKFASKIPRYVPQIILTDSERRERLLKYVEKCKKSELLRRKRPTGLSHLP